MPSLTTRASAQQQNAGLPDIQTTGDGVDMCLDSVTGQGNSEYHSSPTTSHPTFSYAQQSKRLYPSKMFLYCSAFYLNYPETMILCGEDISVHHWLHRTVILNDCVASDYITCVCLLPHSL